MATLIDTNFLVDAIKFKVDLGRLDEPIVLSSCVDELKKISESGKRHAAEAKLALRLLEEKNVRIIETAVQGDKAILNYAKNSRCAVATNDRELIKSLKKLNIKVIRFRQRRFLMEA